MANCLYMLVRRTRDHCHSRLLRHQGMRQETRTSRLPHSLRRSSLHELQLRMNLQVLFNSIHRPSRLSQNTLEGTKSPGRHHQMGITFWSLHIVEALARFKTCTMVSACINCHTLHNILTPGTESPDAPKVTYPFPAYIVDHFSPAGVEAGVKYWNEHILSPQLRPLLKRFDSFAHAETIVLIT
jgi:hypothetical protein